jgi:anthranilate synthase/aminodeoxychorismate synthase-like glutamine amidotransferase
MILVLDNRDSFTFNLAQALQGLGCEVEVHRADGLSAEDALALAPERILVGPGPGGPAQARTSLDLITRAGDLPVLGVCLGHQALAHAFGGRVERSRRPLHGRVVQVEHDGAGVFCGLPSPVAFTRYNSLTVATDTLPACLEVTARSADGEVMGLRHVDRPLEGVQFHPESILSSGAGLRLLANFVRPPAERNGAAPPPPSTRATAPTTASAALRPDGPGRGA